MRAVVLKSVGEASKALEYTVDHPKPKRRQGEVMIEVHASSLNPGEWRVRQGNMPSFMVKLPQIMGADVAGVVIEVGPDSKFKVGDRVYGCTDQVLLDPWGTHADFCSPKESRLALIPEGVTFQQAGCMPIAGLTAWQALAPSMPLQGKRVLVHGGAGGIGHFAVQIAKQQGAYVATTCSERNIEFVTKELGADLAIDYNKVKFEEQIAAGGELYDVVVDLVGVDAPRNWKAMHKGGRLAQVSWDQLLDKCRNGGVLWAILWNVLKLYTMAALGLCPRFDNVMQTSDPNKGLKQLGDLVAQGKVKVHVERTVPLEGVIEAHAYAEQRRTRGKIAIQIAGGPQQPATAQ